MTDTAGEIKRISFRKEGTQVPEIIYCRECRFFEWDTWAKVNGIPLIVAHEVCRKWGDGCKTSPDGYCFMAERKEEKS